MELEDFYRGIVCRGSFSTLKLKRRKLCLAAILRFVFTVKNRTLHSKIRTQHPEDAIQSTSGLSFLKRRHGSNS